MPSMSRRTGAAPLAPEPTSAKPQAPAPEPAAPETAASALALHDSRAFFARALAHGLQHGILDAATLNAIHEEAPRGMVQIARYFGSEFLRPELEKALLRMVNLISLHLQEASGGDLAEAAQLLRAHSLLSRSKAGSDMLRQLIALPDSTHFALGGSDEAQTPLLARWSLRTHADYRAEFERRSRIAQTVDAALWLAARYGLDAEDLEEAGTDAESVIRTALLWRALAPRSTAWPTAAALRKVLLAQQKKTPATSTTAKAAKKPAGAGAGAGTGVEMPALNLPPALPAALRLAAEAQSGTVRADGALLLQAGSARLRTLLRPTSSLRAHYFLQDDPLGEVDDYHREFAESGNEADALGTPLTQESTPAPGSKTWERATQGHTDEHALLTLWVSLAAGTPKKTLLTEKNAAALLRKIQKTGFDAERARAFIRDHAPQALRASYLALWDGFVQESQAALCSDQVGAQQQALALLRRECHVVAG